MESARPDIEVILFDVNETLLDLTPVKKSVSAALGGRDDLVPVWFTLMLQYSLVDTLTDDYRSFSKIGIAALKMLGLQNSWSIEDAAAEEAVTMPFLNMPPHMDTLIGLHSLSDSRFRIAALSNSSEFVLHTQFKRAGITSVFERILSTETVRAFKPDQRTYAYAAETLGVDPSKILMVASHAWDLKGANKAGFQTAFIKRKGAVLYPNAPEPDFVCENIEALAATFGRQKEG